MSSLAGEGSTALRGPGRTLCWSELHSRDLVKRQKAAWETLRNMLDVLSSNPIKDNDFRLSNIFLCLSRGYVPDERFELCEIWFNMIEITI